MSESFDALTHVFYRAEVGAKPVSVVIEITHACNVDCEHCYLDLVPDSKIGALGTEEWKRVFRELKAAGCLFLTLTGGEVLVRRDFFELATYARELGMALTIFTNGTLIDERNADRLAALRPMGVEISLLGGIPATHDAIARRRGAFDKTIAGARRMRERGVPVVLKTVLMRKNVVEHAAMRAIADALGCNLLVDVEVSPKDDGSLGPKALVAADEDLLLAMRALVAESIEKYGPPEEVTREERLASTPCAAGRRTCQIGPTGDLFPCTQWKEPVGNLRQTSFADLWTKNETFQRIRATRIKDIPICNECELIEDCGPCMALSLLEVGTIGPSPTKCGGAELRAKAEGKPGRSAWFKKLEAEARVSGTQVKAERPRVHLPLVG
jgi:radical SAM protein with 4Fe4S-binding SPASM domain